MKKIISSLLCLVMMLSMVSLFSSCARSDGEPKVSKKTVEVDLTEYMVVMATDLTVNAKAQVNTFIGDLKTVTGLKIKSQNDAETVSVSTDAKEILVGKTFRTETDKVLKSLGDCGWGIRVFDNKIVIVGTSSFMTRAALAYFAQNYLAGATTVNKTLTVNEKVSLAKVGTIELLAEVEDGNGELYTDSPFKVVYSDSVDDVDQPITVGFGGRDPEPEGGEDVDYTYLYCTDLVKLLRKTTELGNSSFKFSTDAAEENEFEFLIGKVNREDYMAELRKLEANQYGVTIKNGKVMVLAWNDALLAQSELLVQDLITESVIEDNKGNKTYRIPAFASIVETPINSYHVDFPKPEGDGIILDGTVDVSDNSMEYIYSGSGVNRDSFVAYCEKLEDAGYTMLGKENQVKGSSFRQYLNNTTGSTLYVYHSAYTYAGEQGVTDVLPSLRIVASTTESVNLPDSTMLNSNQSYEKKTETMITSLSFDYEWRSEKDNSSRFGMSYIYTLEDGSFIVFDGGMSDASGAWDGSNYIYNTLYDLFYLVHGAAPSDSNPMMIRAWIITHEHSDHHGGFKKFMQTKVNSTVKVERLLFNGASASETVNVTNPDIRTIQGFVKDMEAKYGTKYIKVHTGQVFYFINAKIEILYTHEDAYPSKLEYFNNTSTTCKITTSARGSADVVTGVWLGDLERVGSRRMRAMWGDYLDSDMGQIAHHGVNGCEAALYDLIRPTVVWFPTSAARVKNMTDSPTDKYWPYEVDYHVCREIDSVKLIIAADKYETTMVLTGGKLSEGLVVYNLNSRDQKQITEFTDAHVITPGDIDSGSGVIAK